VKLPRTPESLVAAFDAVFPEDRAHKRKMFGYPSGFVNGHMFAGLFGEDLFVRLADADRGELLALPGARPFEPMGRPMRDYVCVPRALQADRAALRAWLERALAHVSTLPPKAAKGPAKARSAAKAPRAAKAARTPKAATAARKKR
jgi:TfoX/Sxy family transcriptional regulator of competence genes